jgi:hypothetical protein
MPTAGIATHVFTFFLFLTSVFGKPVFEFANSCSRSDLLRPQIETPLGSMGFFRSLLGPARLFLFEFESDLHGHPELAQRGPNGLERRDDLVGVGSVRRPCQDCSRNTEE